MMPHIICKKKMLEDTWISKSHMRNVNFTLLGSEYDYFPINTCEVYSGI